MGWQTSTRPTRVCAECLEKAFRRGFMPERLTIAQLFAAPCIVCDNMTPARAVHFLTLADAQTVYDRVR